MNGGKTIKYFSQSLVFFCLQIGSNSIRVYRYTFYHVHMGDLGTFDKGR